MRHLLILLFSAVIFTGCNESSETSKEDEKYYLDTLVQQPIILTDSSIIDGQWEYMHKKIKIDSMEYYLVEGDLLMNEAEYFSYITRLMLEKSGEEEGVYQKKLIGRQKNGRLIKWPKDTTLFYAVIENSFASHTQYEKTKQNFEIAAAEWEAICGIKFIHADTLDSKTLHMPKFGLTFIVCSFNTGGDFIASSFFPDEPIHKRCVYVDPTYFISGYDPVGIFRHEIGHILGFHHEHIRKEAPRSCPKEMITGLVPLSSYDSKSVMHYYCGEKGDLQLKITNTDRVSAAAFYLDSDGLR